jgi:hypothetical protein
MQPLLPLSQVARFATVSISSIKYSSHEILAINDSVAIPCFFLNFLTIIQPGTITSDQATCFV